MKNFIGATAMSCAAICLSLALTTTPAKADDMGSDFVRSAQMRLAGMGYYVGRYDGTMGPVTENAIRDFQHANGLASTGSLNSQTYNLITSKDFALNHQRYMPSETSYYDGFSDRYAHSIMISDNRIMWDNRWHYATSHEIPSRFGQLDLNEDNVGSVRHYAVTLNGQPILFANNQPYVLRVSKTFALNNEDAVIFTAYNGDSECAYKSYLLTIHGDGSFNRPREIGNCTNNFEAHVADNALFMSFPTLRVSEGWSTWDVWRYESNALVRL